MEDRPILSESHWFWPVVLFPYEIERAHTLTATGKGVLGGMKSSLSRVTLELTETGLMVRGRLSGFIHFAVAPGDVTSCELVGESPEVVEVRFTTARRSRLARLVLSGSPAGARDRVILNVDAPAEWKSQIERVFALG